MRGKDIIVESHRLADIFIVGERRPLVEADIDALARSIEAIGLRSPIWIRYVDFLNHPEEGELHGAFVLVAGRHRMEAMKRLGRETIDCIVFQGDEVAARKWEIAENLHRSDLTDLQRKEQIAEWIRLTDGAEKLAQHAPVSLGGRGKEGGINAAARDLGIERTEAQRAVKVASISEQAKQAAISAHLDNNQSALLKIAASQPAEQVEKVRQLAAERDARRASRSTVTVPLAADPISDEDAVEKQLAKLNAAWNAAGPEARQRFRDQLDAPIMDRRHA
ncbi:ParB/RepB/Spo0J family partition protein [Methylorubrum extorquens]|uniref:ParB-like N-terminal domain-containing protein n=1 Tax=Methylorubrum extorquens (strain ATCC 14718 / DSM 1338 / JCM 2805 / NCIMB 9133 / AM1) TaxID=272630 RepID=C5B0R0_METEA|nr:ParB/RepB/Spo0J family partition protein [Methylorubrum extorquens]ACS41647.1 Hypothetical protein MexAM1_META1p3965 [Methylorubrum extorquens AM1]MCP1545340.1 ParB family chromosome partitioning protein [Methylorubrum extorquens]MCP1587313.1 ParB family chromosome partitioning protein [Methylorubrum extorquens]